MSDKFNQDNKWLEAKRIGRELGVADNWLEMITLYHNIGGSNIFIYAIIDNQKYLIVDVLDDEHVILLDSSDNPVIEDYKKVFDSKKIFSYSDSFRVVEKSIKNSKHDIKFKAIIKQ